MKFFSLLTAVLGLSLASTVQAQSTDDLLMNSAYSTSLGTVVGSEVTYHFQLSNIGVDPVTFLLNEMTVPANHTFVSANVPTGTCMVTTTDVECTDAFTLNGGSTETYSFTFMTGTAICPLSSSFYANAVVISGTDTNSTNNGGTATATFDCLPSSSSSSSSSFSSSSSSFSSSTSSSGFDPNNFLMDSAYSTSVGTVVGSQVTYFFQLSNNGAYPVTFLLNDMTVPAGHTFVSANVPTGTCMVTTTDVECTDAFTLNGGSTETYSFTFDTDSGTCPLTPSFYANAVVISGTDTNSTNNGGTATANFACIERDIQLTSSVNTSSPQPGDTVELTYVVTNIGNVDLSGFYVNILFPSNLEFISATPSDGSYDNSLMEWEVPGLAQLGTVTLVIVARIPADAPNTLFEVMSEAMLKGDVNFSDNISGLSFTSTTVSTPTTGGGGGGRRSGGVPSASFGGLAEAAFGGLTEAETLESCLAFQERNPVFSDVTTNMYLQDIELWGQTAIAISGERLITGFNNHSTFGDTTPAFMPSAKVSRMQAAKMILVAHCISIPLTIPVPEDGFEFADLPVSTDPYDAANYFAARVMYTAYNNGIVLGRGGKMANPFAEATFVEVLAMMLRIDQPNLEDGTNTWYSTYVDFASTIDLDTSVGLSSLLQRDMFLYLLTTSINNSVHDELRSYVTKNL